MASEVIFPVYTSVSGQPVTIFQSLDRQVFDYPFFNKGVQKRRVFAADKKLYEWENLPMSGEQDLLPLKGFIFHTSHCGSTLLARMLGSLPGVRVVSETEAINGLLLSAIFYNIPEQQVLSYLHRIMETYRQPMEGDKWLIFKLTSWNVFFIGLFQQLYPNVPWIYLDRATDEVVQSLLSKGSGFADWWDHPADVLRQHFIEKDFISSDKESFLRHMVNQHRYHAQKNMNSNACLLKYPAFIHQFESVILPHFKLFFRENEIREAMETTRYDSKEFEKILYANTDKI